MLVTFEQTGHIPTKRHLFFERAFDALFAVHDASKEGVYKRKTYTNLSVDEFRNFMAAFCIIFYLKSRQAFSPVEFRETVQIALRLEKRFADLEDITSDLIESTCLIQHDGIDYNFTHRSFQEYFAAVFITRDPAFSAGKLLERIYSRINDDVVELAFSINKGFVEREWIIPQLEDFFRLQAEAFDPQDPLTFVNSMIGTVFLSIVDRRPQFIDFHLNENGQKIFSILRLYQSKDDPLLFNFRPQRSDVEIFTTAYVEIAKKRDPRLESKHDGRLQRVGTRGHTDRRIELAQVDTEWLLKTTFPAYIASIIGCLKSILGTAKNDAFDQEDIIAQLTPPNRNT